MKIINIKYGKTYSLGNFCSERIDLEASIDTDTEDVCECLEKLKDTCDTYHKANNPQLYAETPTYISSQWEEQDSPPPPPTKTPEERIIDQINQCSDIVVLKTFELLANKNPNLQEAYQNKLKQLQP